MGRGHEIAVDAVDEAALRRRAGEVLDFLEGFVGSLPVPGGHRGLLLLHLEEGREQAAEDPALPAIQLPLLVHAAISGEEAPAVPAAGACLLLYLGADLLDNLADDELPTRWLGRGPQEVSLVAATYLSALPGLALARLGERGAPPEKLAELSRLFAQTLLTMSAGQREDLVSPEGISLEECRAVAERRSGAEIGLFAKAGAVVLAADDARLHKAYASMGASIGTAGQIASDLHDLWRPEPSQDLLNGKKTLPVVHALSTLRGGGLENLRRLLAAARESAEPHAEARKVLLEAGSLRYAALVVEVYRRRALEGLAGANPREAAGGELRALLEETSLLAGANENAAKQR